MSTTLKAKAGRQRVQNRMRRRVDDLTLQGLSTVPAFAQSATGVAIVSAAVSQTVPAFSQAFFAGPVPLGFTSKSVAGRRRVQNFKRRRDDFLSGLTALQSVPAFTQTATATLTGIQANQNVPAFAQDAQLFHPNYVAGTNYGIAGAGIQQFLLRRRAEFFFLFTHSGQIPDFTTTATGIQVQGIIGTQQVPVFSQAALLTHVESFSQDSQIPAFDQIFVVAHLGFLSASADQIVEDFGTTAVVELIARLQQDAFIPAFGTVAHATNYDFTDPDPERTLKVLRQIRTLYVKRV
jgi:hypothetical protein